MKTNRIDIRVSPENKEAWVDMAKSLGLTLTQLIEKAIKALKA